MYDLNYFHNKLIITPFNIQEEILKKIDNEKQLYNIKFMTLEQFYESFTFSITKEMLYYVTKHYNLSVDIATKYLQTIQDTMFIVSDCEKITYLSNIKQDLINNHFIHPDNNIHYYNTLDIVIFGYSFIERKYLNCINQLQSIEIIKPDLVIKKSLLVHEYKTIEQEINGIINDIITKINNGIDINHIKITGITNDYHFLLQVFSDMYHLPITIPNTISLYDTNIGKEFLHTIKMNTADTFLKQNQNIEITLKLINILNQYPFRKDFADIYDLLVSDLKHTYINKEYQNSVQVVNFNNLVINDDDYIYVMGLNQGNIPQIRSDEDYLSDNIKAKIGLTTTIEINKSMKEEVMNKLSTINHLYMSYSLASTFSSLQPSTIINEFEMTKIIEQENISNYSHIYNQYLLNNKLDDYKKYGSQDDILACLKGLYSTKEFDSYDNSFKGINKDILNKKMHNQVQLSYTSLNKYNECAFSYYVEKVLKLNIYEDKFATKVGSVYHQVLEEAFQEGFNFEKSFVKAIDDYFVTLTNKERFLLNRLKEELQFIIDTIKEQLQYINYESTEYEHEVNIEINDHVKIVFKGIIDKMFYHEDGDRTYVAIVDYKTGNIDTVINNCKFGLNLQLPIYIYLSKRSKLKNVYVTGFYYQTILQNEIKAEDSNDYLKRKKAYLKLQGYTIDTNEDIVHFDNTEDNSLLIQGLKRKKDGTFDSHSKVLTEEQIVSLERLVENKIIEAGNKIINGIFPINPKQIDYNNISCRFCKYKDLCYMKPKDLEKLSKPSDLKFLKEYK